MSPTMWGGGSTTGGGSITARNLIYDALRQLGAMRAGQGPSADAFDDYFRLLNQLVDAWNAEKLMQRVTVRETTTTTAGEAAYTFGPAKIDGAGYIAAGSANESEIEILSPGRWAAIADKSTPGAPCQCFSDNGDPEQALTLYPVPDEGGTLVTYSVRSLEAFADLDTAYGFPAGYQRALMYNLASDMAPAVAIHTKIAPGAVLLGSIERKAVESKSQIKSRNTRPLELRCDPALVGRSSFDIYRGY